MRDHGLVARLGQNRSVPVHYSGTSCSGGTILAGLTLTRLAFISADGTETELVDQVTGGAIQSPLSCSSTGPSRGTVFVARDGSAARFVADSPIYDTAVMTYGEFTPSGVLYWRNGVRYKIESGLVKFITDRNGNYISLTYDIYGGLTSVEDGLGREITITPTQSLDTLTFKGAGWATRTIKVAFDLTSNALDSRRTCVLASCAVPTRGDLFGAYAGASTTTADLRVVTSVTLPDNVRKYQFQYNDYSELSQVTLPTGGVIRYTHGPGNGYSVIYNAGRPYVYRRALSRDVYPDGTHLEQHAVYSAAYSNTTFGSMPYYLTTVTEHHYDGLATSIDAPAPITAPLAHERHYFYGGSDNPYVYPLEIAYPFWLDGREYQSDALDINGTTVLHSTANTWAQRACGTDEVCLSSLAQDYSNRNGSLSPTDPQLLQVKTTLESGQVSLVGYLYDRYNNRIRGTENDYGSASAGTSLRQIDTTYETATTYTTPPVYLPSLPKTEIVSLGGTQYARTDYELALSENSTEHSFYAAFLTC